MLKALLAMLLGALAAFGVILSSFRLSNGCNVELTLAAIPTNNSVAEERVRACNSGAPGKAWVDSIAGMLSAMASDSDDGGFSED